ncbi:Hypothetical predicted protein [Mytilus galloprovincialis]|uniref:Uncharacterized protein n=1 Tax=Mytilus galloprovincialis TaxID=29158 RepID=A0A8B6GUT0_MYTGA|nr:Hypothetical predicted protein [Mytilus galloprovincialis]
MDNKREGTEPSSEPQGLFYGQQQDKNENQTLTTDENKLLQDEGKKETLTPADENKPLPAEVKNSLASDENKLLPADEKKELLSNVQTDIKETSASNMIPRKNDTEIESINSCSGASHNNPNDNKSHVRESPKAKKHAHLHTDDQITDAMIDHMGEILLAGKIKEDKSEDLVECGIWDFAGRKDYYVAHQTFFIQKAIYILVADIRETIGPIQDDENFKSVSSGGKILKYNTSN